MPLVFVHGIANRRERGAYSADRLRDALFAEHFLAVLAGPGSGHQIHTAHWGDLGGKLRWGGDSIPQGRGEPLGGDGNRLEDTLGQIDSLFGFVPQSEDRLVLNVALKWLPDAVDLLFTLLPPPADDEAAEALATLGAQLSRYYGPDFSENAQQQAIAWLSGLDNDEQFIRAMSERVPSADNAASVPAQRTDHGAVGGAAEGVEVLGAGRKLTAPWTALRDGARALRRASQERALRGPITFVRNRAAKSVPLFVGDITEYLARRGSKTNPGPIVRRVVDTLERACAERTPELPLYVVAHSMGGNIVYDILSHFRPDLQVDVLVTVGSQTGLFEELKLFCNSDPTITGGAGSRISAPPTVGRWLNVVDINDPLAFNAEPIFEGVEDYSYTSKAWWAHSALLHQPTFHARLAHRLAQARPGQIAGRAE